MNVSSLMLAAAILAQDPASSTTSPDPAALVGRLASDVSAERDAASSALKALGTAALPPLRAARDGTASALQARVAALVQAIEGEELIRPRTIALAYEDRPMSEVVEDLTARTGCRVSIYEKQTGWLATRVTLLAPSPVPFWSAVDKVCEAGRFAANLGSGPDGPGVRLFRGSSTGPVSDHGAFRVQLQAVYFNGRHGKLHLKADRDPASTPIAREADRDKSCVEMKVSVEPRMLIRNAGKLKGLSAVDDRGQSLIPPDPTGEQRGFAFGFTPAAFTLGQIPLARVERPGRVFKALRGFAPVAVAALRSEPVVILLLDAAGKSLRGEDTVVTIRAVSKRAVEERVVVEEVDSDGQVDGDRPGPEEGVSVALTIRPIDRGGPPAPAPGVCEEQFEVVDAAGKVWTETPWIVSGVAPEVREGEVRHTLLLSGENLAPMPWPRDFKGLTLRYREMIIVPVDVPFEFKDVPLP